MYSTVLRRAIPWRSEGRLVLCAVSPVLYDAYCGAAEVPYSTSRTYIVYLAVYT